ncbi:flavin-containing monooxygenase [Arthrobacter alpinus]|nr:NAD(P)-binding domain-containing protein [Arthrobacter alpinus]
MNHHQIIIVGGGQAGLAAARAAIDNRMRPILVDASGHAGGAWRRYYDSLKLFSPARFSSLPGMPFPGAQERYPHRDEVVEYLAAYSRTLEAEILRNTKVSRVERAGGFTVHTAAGEALYTDRLVVATGSYGSPIIPELPGLASFKGRILHSKDYKSVKGFEGLRVVVVGGGNSAIQIAVELSHVARVSVASRRKIQWQRQRLLGQDLHWWLHHSGLDRSQWIHRLRGAGVPVVDDGSYRSALQNRHPEATPMFTRVVEEGVMWASGETERVDVLLFATGFRPDVSMLRTIGGALSPTGEPLHTKGVSTTVPGLGFVGLEHQRGFASATLRGVGGDARHVMNRIKNAG